MAKKTAIIDPEIKNNSTYVLFGFCRKEPEEVGYLAKIPQTDEDEGVIATELSDAKRFPGDKIDAAKDFINQEFIDLYGPYAFAFHKVKVMK